MISITPSHIIEYLFCPRFTYFEYVLRIPQYEDRHYKVEKGRQIHDQKQKINKDYLRKKLGVIEKQTDKYLTNNHIRGVIDEILFLSDDTLAPLDYKFAKWEEKIYETYKTQLFCYAKLIEHNYGKKVNKGFIVYTRSKNKLIEIDILESDKNRIMETTKSVIEIIEKNLFPKSTKYKTRCLSCTYRNICIK